MTVLFIFPKRLARSYPRGRLALNVDSQPPHELAQRCLFGARKRIAVSDDGRRICGGTADDAWARAAGGRRSRAGGAARWDETHESRARAAGTESARAHAAPARSLRPGQPEVPAVSHAAAVRRAVWPERAGLSGARRLCTVEWAEGDGDSSEPRDSRCGGRGGGHRADISCHDADLSASDGGAEFSRAGRGAFARCACAIAGHQRAR